MDDKDAQLRGKLEDLFSDLSESIQAEASPAAPLKSTPERAPGADRRPTGQLLAALRTLAENATDAILLSDLAGRVTFSNRACCNLLGYNYVQKEMVGLETTALWPDEERARLTGETQSVPLALTREWHGQVMQRRKDGSLLRANLTLFPVPDEQDQPIAVASIIRDLTEHKQAEEALVQERSLLRTLIDNLPDYIYVKDAEGRFVTANMAVVRQMGLTTLDELVGKTDFDFFPHELAEQYYADEQRIIQSGEGLHEYEGPALDAGEEKWVSTSKVPLRDAQGKVYGFVGLGRDITVRKRTEEALAREQYLMNALMDNIPDYIYFKDLQSRFVRTTRAHARAFGLSDPAGAVGKTDFDFFTEEHARPAYEDEQEIIRTGRPLSKEEKETWPDRPDTWVLTTKMPLRDKAGDIVGTFGISSDITERKQAEEALRESEEKYRTILENIQEGYFEVDIAGNFTFFNDALCRVLGYPRDELMGMNNREYMDAENAKGVYRTFNEVYRTQRPSQTFSYEVIRKDGTRRSIEMSTSLMTDSTGEPIGFRGIMRDITERKRAEETLNRRARQLQTAAEVSRAASSILDPDELLSRVVGLIRDHFNLYYAGLFLVDETGQCAVLRAGTGEAGQKMLGAHHQLEIGGSSMIAWCITNRQARIALDVGQEAVRFANPLLPLTRSEMALPLISRDRVIGAMTIQSDRPAAFTQEDTTVLQSMADQTANAIGNARLFEVTQRRAAREQMAAQITARMRETLDIDTVLQTAIREIGDAMGIAEVEVRLASDVKNN